jgi:spermidine/putrescine transport system substrate-binding protein
MRKMTLKNLSLFLALTLGATSAGAFFSGENAKEAQAASEKPIVLRVCNWEEYMDLGEWDPEEETIDLESGDILGENALYEDFEEYYLETFGREVIVEYSCFGTNEELYNMLTLGDVYDLVCPSDYMLMKLMTENKLQAFSDEFFDEENPYNYYVRNLSPFIRDTFENHQIGGEPWSRYAAGYMWGVTGILYNPEEVDAEDVQTWGILNNPEYFRQVTIKDNVRDSYFAALGALRSSELTDPAFTGAENYGEALEELMNDTSEETVAQVQEYLQSVKDNVYSFETDSGKADMITGKVLANYQWSGDAVYAMDQAEEDDFYLNFAVPDEVTNLWFDGWCMLKKGIEEDPEKQQVAEAFVNFLSRPDNAVRNMYYIGYTSVISGGEDGDQVFEYLDWNYGAEEDEEDTVAYNVGYFFDPEGAPEDYTLIVPEESLQRQLFAQYPPEDVIRRGALMRFFDGASNAQINRMWINVRCYNINNVPFALRVILVLIICSAMVVPMIRKHKKG